MSLLDQNSLIKINLYYKYVDKDSGKQLVIVKDEEGKEIIENKDEKISKSVEFLETEWSILTWKEQNEVLNLSQKINSQTGENQFNFLAYRDAIIKRCLKSWNITVNNQPVPVTLEAIDQLPGIIVINLYQKFETLIDYTEQELGN